MFIGPHELSSLQSDNLGVRMKKKWWRSLRIKIVAWSFIPTVIILSAVAWFTYYSYQQVLVDLAIKQDSAIVNTKMIQVTNVVNNLFNSTLRPVILNIDTNPELSPEVRAQNILDLAPNLEVFDGGIYFVDQCGIIFKTQPEQPGMIGRDWSDTSQFRYVRDNLQVRSITDIRAIGQTGGLCVPSGRCTTRWANLLVRPITVLLSSRMNRTLSTNP
jgi:hypothetical protein